jgi:uncharacterized repeat protein (TIGR03803 family)
MKTACLTDRFVCLTIAAVALAVTAAAVSAQQAATYEIVSSFEPTFVDGRHPSVLRQLGSGGVLGTDFIGTALLGGRFDRGTLFHMDAAGVVHWLHHFSGPDGAQPFALVRASPGRFYGMTSQGGAFGFGTIFVFLPGDGVVLGPAHSFSATDRLPVDMFAASDGSVYGLTAGGGDFGNGTIFVIPNAGGNPPGNLRTIYSFGLSAGSSMSSLVKASDGRFYGTAERGGAAGFGTLYTIDDAGALTILHSFAGRDQGDGEGPVGLMQSRDGRLYGTTRGGGEFGDGTVYSIGLTGDYRVLHSFSRRADGAQPSADLLEASDGNLYGTTPQGFSRSFRIDSSGTLTILHDLTETPGAREFIQGADGRLYAPTEGGGLDGGGTIIRMELQWTLTTLHDFRAGAGAGRPNGVIQSRNGRFYGTTRLLSPTPQGPIGTVFAMDAAGTRTTVHTFRLDRRGQTSDGSPIGNLFEDTDGSLYGTTFTELETVLPPGQVFKISPAGLFTTVASAYRLQAGVIRARDGRLYGTEAAASDPLSGNYGSVFRVEADGTRTVLHEFDGTDSANPVSELVETDDGSLYGTTGSSGVFGPPVIGHGTIFRVDPATRTVTTRYRFSGPDGSNPLGRLIQGSDGLIYGTTVSGGVFGRGTVFSLDAAGTLTTVHHFAGPDGRLPGAGVTQGLDGRLYGTTSLGGAFDNGSVFVMDVITGRLTTLHDLTVYDGSHPETELIQANDGAFYGAASAGVPNFGGVIFRVRLATSPPDGYFEIVSRNSGKCLDVFGASTDAGASAIQWICHGGPNQQWRLEPAGGGAFRIIARHSGQALDVFGASVDDVAPIIQWPVHGGDNQVWTLEPASDGYVRIVARHSGKAMDVEFASPDDGARVIQYTPHGGANQQWLLRMVSTPP